MIAGMSICVKFIHVISIAAVLFVGSRCMTAAALHAARGERLDKPNGFKECEEKNKKPDFPEANYLLLPITVPLDVATLPCVIPSLILFMAFGPKC
jgi:hypothetical protein